jgi:hypothetical protein
MYAPTQPISSPLSLWAANPFGDWIAINNDGRPTGNCSHSLGRKCWMRYASVD